MRNRKTHRFAFRPTLDEFSLEERVVLNAAGAHAAAMVSAAQTGSLTDITQRQLHAAFARQFRQANAALRAFIKQQVNTAFANGAPERGQRADLQATVNGADRRDGLPAFEPGVALSPLGQFGPIAPIQAPGFEPGCPAEPGQ